MVGGGRCCTLLAVRFLLEVLALRCFFLYSLVDEWSEGWLVGWVEMTSSSFLFSCYSAHV